MDQIRTLLKSSKAEDKIAAVFLSNRILDSSSNSSTSSSSGGDSIALSRHKELLAVLFQGMPSREVITLLQLQQYPQVQKAALNLLLHACSEIEHAAHIISHRELLLQTFFTFASSEQFDQQQLRRDVETLLLHLVMASSDHDSIALFHAVFTEGNKQARTYPHVILSLLSELCTLLTPFSPVVLTSEEMHFLQSCVVQGLHGAAQEDVRDTTLKSTLELLRSQHVLRTEWILCTVATKKESSADKAQSLLSLLCSIVYGELHLIEEELLYFVRRVTDVASADENNKGELSFAQKKQRSIRDVKMFYVCMDVVDWIVALLLSNSDEETEEQNEQKLKISYLELQQLHKDLYKIVEELWEYFKSFVPIMRSIANETSQGMEVTFVRLTITRALSTLKQLVFEDAELRRQLFNNLEHLMQVSVALSSTCDMSQLTMEVDVQYGEKLLTNAQLSLSSSSTTIQEKDVLCELIQIVSVVLQDVVYDSFRQQQPLDEESEVIVEKLCEQGFILVSFTNLLLQQLLQGDGQLQLSFASILEASVKSLFIILAVKESALKTLIRGEGVLAFQELLHCPGTAFQQLHTNLNNFLKQKPAALSSVIEDAKQLRDILLSCSALELSLEDLNQL